jgi:DDB1- and CUL4-associated factor 12
MVNTSRSIRGRSAVTDAQRSKPDAKPTRIPSGPKTRSHSPVKSFIDWWSQDSSATLRSSSSREKLSSWASPQELLETSMEEIVANTRSEIELVNLFEYSSMNPEVDFEGYVMRKNPATLKEKLHDTKGLDKIFTSAWLSDTEVVMGTKCNRIVVMNVDTGKQTIIPSPSLNGSLPDGSGRALLGANSAAEPTDPIDIINMNMLQQCSGIHSIAINDSKTLLAVGYGKTSETIQIYKLPEFEAVALLKGHSDMIFSLQWLNDSILVSGSRDKSVKLWNLKDKPFHHDPREELLPVFNCTVSRTEHRDKVRDLVLDKRTKDIYSLGADGFIKIWDAKRPLGEAITSVALVHTNETVCMAIDSDNHIVSVGSQSHISLLDPRCASIVHTFESLDEGWGVRSMNISKSLVTIGGGIGRISFFDLRKMAYIEWESNTPLPIVAPERRGRLLHPLDVRYDTAWKWLEPSAGWLHRDPIYINHFQGADIKNAVYTLSYDDTGTRLFAAGGPLQLNLKGSYAGLWC